MDGDGKGIIINLEVVRNVKEGIKSKRERKNRKSTRERREY